MTTFPEFDGDWFCTFEDRPDCAVTLGILAGSIAVHSPGTRLLVATPLNLSDIRPALPPECLHVQWRPAVGGWNVKPELLENILSAGARTAAWIDADIFVYRDIRLRLPADPSVLVVAGEVDTLPSRDMQLWSRRLGREPGRVLPRQINSAFVRAGPVHLPLLRMWREVCHSPSYQEEQSKPFALRKDPFKGDQDILSGLLSSEEFRGVDYHVLRSGRDIAHLLGLRGFSLSDRLATLWRGVPPLLHAHGYPKPWAADPDDWLALNPYVCAVRDLAGRRGWEIPWVSFPGARASLFYRLSFGQPALAGLPFMLKP